MYNEFPYVFIIQGDYMKKIGGLTLILSLLFTSIIIMLAQISLHLDKLDKTHKLGIYNHIPLPVYIIMAILYIFGFVTLLAEK